MTLKTPPAFCAGLPELRSNRTIYQREGCLVNMCTVYMNSTIEWCVKCKSISFNGWHLLLQLTLRDLESPFGIQLTISTAIRDMMPSGSTRAHKWLSWSSSMPKTARAAISSSSTHRCMASARACRFTVSIKHKIQQGFRNELLEAMMYLLPFVSFYGCLLYCVSQPSD